MPPVIEFTRIGRTYPGPPPVTALKGVNLVVRRGEYVSVVGPSGSGKSTFLNLIGMLDRPTTGTYRFDGIETSGLREKQRTALRGRRIGFVFQAFHLLPHRNAAENVMLSQLYVGVNRKERRRHATAMLDKVGLSHRATALTSQMSGGERQRVAIARALVNEPSLLLCDEPTGNLDSKTAHEVMSLIESLHASGLTVLLVTHDESLAARALRTVMIRDGSLTESIGETR
ncbi:ABC transporter ATP-binding protein [Actinomadura meridiana]|uniref:ABC transporter ATP-binding protein n=2 Tax=Actinomadura meridiana TaxID=559626 RepID=A0ABP8C6X0_9ACTN